MSYNKISNKIDEIKNGKTISSQDITNLSNEIEECYYNGGIHHSEASKLRDELSKIDFNNVTPFDSHKEGLDDLLNYYYQDYQETNHEGYDLHEKIDLDSILYISEKIDNQQSFTQEQSKDCSDFLHSLKEEYSEISIIKALDYMINYIENNTK